MKLREYWLGIALAVGLVGCGGGGGSTLVGGGSNTAAAVAHVTVVSAVASIPSDGSSTATITATVTDASNVALSGVAVAFSASAGGVLSVTQGTTDANGVAKATLQASTATAGSAISVTAQAGGIQGSVAVNVVAAAHTLSLKTDSPQIPSDGSKLATVTAILKDSSNNALANVAVSFSATSGVVVATQATTDANGVAKATLSAGEDPTNRSVLVTASAPSAQSVAVQVDVIGSTLSVTGPVTLVIGGTGQYTLALRDAGGHAVASQSIAVATVSGNPVLPATVLTDVNGLASVTVTAQVSGTETLTATGLGMSASRSIGVSSQSLAVTAPALGTQIALGASQTVTAHWANAAAGSVISFTTTRGLLDAPTATTDASGNASVHISSVNAGPAILTASAGGVNAQTIVDFIATSPTQVTVQASPASVVTGGTSIVTAVVRDAQNNLVEGQTVDFSLVDPTGGSLSVPSALTDGQGRIQTLYTAGSATSGANGVTVKATVRSSGVNGSTTLTVGGQTVYVSLGTGNTIDSPTSATYSITYAAFAVDAQGAPVPNATVSFKVLPIAYAKGQRVWSATANAYTTSVSTLPTVASCANEDVDYTGIFSVTKDYNGNGKLDPGNVAVLDKSAGTTGADGSLMVTVSYPKDHAFYVQVQLMATTAVTGTQSTTTSTFWLPYAATDFAQQATSPPGPVSPYGTGSTCSDPN